VKSNGVNAVLKFLGNNYSKGIARCVSFHNKLFGPIWGAKDRVVAACFFEFQEGVIAFICPDELFIFTC